MNDLSFSRRQALGALSAGVATIALPATARAMVQGAAPAGEANVVALLASIGENLLSLSPEGATSLGLDIGARTGLRAQLADRSQAGQDKVAAVLRADLSRAEAVDTNGLTHSTKTSVEVVKSAYRVALDGFAQPYGDIAVGGWRNTPYVVIQNVGAYLDVPRFLDTDHRIENAQDAEAYISRLEGYAVQLDGELGRLRAAAGKGLIAPAFLIDKATNQLKMTIDGTRGGGTLVESIERRTKDIPGSWAERARAIARQKVAPALERQLAELTRQRANATMDAGMWARPGGPEFYHWALRASTTTRMTPDEIHQMGLDQVAELHGRMDVILKKLGYSRGSVGSRMIALSNDPRYKFAEGDPGRAEIMAFIQQRLEIIRAQLPRAFRTLVRGNLEVKRLPPEEEPGAPGAYGGAGSIDGTIPGKFWINLRTTDLHRKYDLPDLTHHEAIPGHVWQGEYSNQLPLIRTMLAFNAYSEGWALYAEQLADELGVYDNFEVGRLGYLQSLAFRAIRLVVDTGLHHKRWTREQGVRYFVETNGSKPEEVASEVDRYCSWVGQACGYKIGHTEIVRQRSRAQHALGARYDLRDFDDTVVKGGNVPLDVLAKNIDEYISTARG